MPSVIVYRTSYLNQVAGFITSVDPSGYQGRPDVKIYDDTTTPLESAVKAFLEGKPIKYLKVSGDAVVDMEQAEIDQVNADEAAALLAQARQAARDSIADRNFDALLIWIIARLNDIRVLPIIAMTPITKADALTEINTNINGRG